jgi:cobalamin-dependent methionine synthase I
MLFEKNLVLSGLEPLVISKETNFVNVGERTNVTRETIKKRRRNVSLSEAWF